MIIEGKILSDIGDKELTSGNIYEVSEKITIKNCIIGNIFLGYIFKKEVILEHSLIRSLEAVGGWFEGGLTLTNCIVRDKIRFEASGHNKQSVIIENNVFHCFVDFFDAHYEESFIFRNNILLSGSNLLGNKGLVVQTLFSKEVTIENNIGDLFLSNA